MEDSLTPVSLEAVAHQLLSAVAATRTLSDDLLVSLSLIFKHGLLQQALDIVDRKCITRMKCPANRVFYQVAGSAGRFYICLPDSNYCSCMSYVFSVLKSESSYCKHVLAVKLADALAQCLEQDIDDTQYLTMLCASELNETGQPLGQQAAGPSSVRA
ncbi:hypothetical protein CAOG_08816 [Capsaspora owczarzaki ATCC 30864]|uniref:SWIM-type domain-containing protein n=1 Tax=Capsaspora owczarzaki (strain ATCC 30864) TaxID=595528 RepID=A0A0D2X3C0_CAPO3|nr:hypothetical protein CAOG_08816 [Capsaspora owczarzaki ATCC 30864]KJE94044.1 hypothetical protein CAOG_008816 [Capsaspora owczarzaki ATCC 30864]|eukprot:XP_011270456.1 hypothetical protein CAOG_08816 [Capsaspora owczarzaki ATCC 30864]